MKRAAVVAIAAGAAALLVGGGAAVWWFASRSPGPDVVAGDFLAALAAGDGARAATFLEDPPEAAAADALEGAVGLLTDPAVVSIGAVEEGTTRADVAFDLDGAAQEASFGLVETEGGWRIAPDALGALTPTTTIGDALHVGGVLTPASATTSLFPAVYDVAAAPSGILAGSATVIVLPGSSQEVAVEASLSPDATASAQEQIDAYATACAAPASTVPENCGIRVPWAADLGALSSIAFRIDAMPVVAFSADARTFAATGGVLVATATGTTRDGAAQTVTYRADDWALRGTVAFTGDDMVLSVD
ncbi:hypothetical protein [Microbacterium sp. RU33B]|uniref:hypothetical protein n=1 Tax=Microbacterium sp. RU33B TaxID=1907390 RepID=UPI00095E5DB3|nr:hypothetical protein [Microbacterium sp. RU33B]SIT71287.1 hypothetical protein SAMN05880545_0834 [Microbacterium sp. RU33B]